MSFDDLTLADLAAPGRNAIVGGPFGSNLVSSDYVAAGVPVIRGANMGAKWVGGEFVFVSEEKAEQLRQNIAVPYDLVFTQRGTLGQVSIVPAGVHDRYVVSQSQMKITVDPTKADVNYLYYLFNSPSQLAYIRNAAIQTGVPHTNLGILKKTPVRIPPLPVQQEVAAVLGSLDQRIALLHESNATLESIAQALFKSWFVDFEPVRAKQEGRLPGGMDDATAVLFADCFEETSIGLVPKGWTVGSILDVATLLSGGTPRTAEPAYWGGGIPWASAKDVSQCNGTVLIDTDRTITPRGLAESSTRMIPAMATVVVARGATTGRMALFGNEMAMNQTCYALESKRATPIALYCQLRREIGALVNAAHGSVFDTITTDTFVRSSVVHPPHALAGRFDEIARPVFEKIIAGTRHMSTLVALRDTLLPRLISGQLRLSEVEQEFAEARTGT